MKINIGKIKKILTNKIFIFSFLGVILLLFILPSALSNASSMYRETILNVQGDIRYVTMKGEVSFNKETGEIEDTIKLTDFTYETFVNPLSVVDSSDLYIQYKELGSLSWRKSDCKVNVAGLKTDNTYNFECKNIPMNIGDYTIRLGGTADLDYSIWRKAVEDIEVTSKEYSMSIQDNIVDYNGQEYSTIPKVNFQNGFNIGNPIYNNEREFGEIKDVELKVTNSKVLVSGTIIPNTNNKFLLESSYNENRFWSLFSLVSSSKSVCDDNTRFPSVFINNKKNEEVNFALTMDLPLTSGDGFIYIYTAAGCGEDTHDFVKIPFDYIGSD